MPVSDPFFLPTMNTQAKALVGPVARFFTALSPDGPAGLGGRETKPGASCGSGTPSPVAVGLDGAEHTPRPVSNAAEGWVKRALMRIQGSRGRRWEGWCSTTTASCVHGSMEVLESVLLLLLSSLISSVLFISVVIGGQLMAAKGAGICLA